MINAKVLITLKTLIIPYYIYIILYYNIYYNTYIVRNIRNIRVIRTIRRG